MSWTLSRCDGKRYLITSVVGLGTENGGCRSEDRVSFEGMIMGEEETISL